MTSSISQEQMMTSSISQEQMFAEIAKSFTPELYRLMKIQFADICCYTDVSINKKTIPRITIEPN